MEMAEPGSNHRTLAGTVGANDRDADQRSHQSAEGSVFAILDAHTKAADQAGIARGDYAVNEHRNPFYENNHEGMKWENRK